MLKYFFSALILLTGLLSLFLQEYNILCTFLFIIVVLQFVDKLGKGIVLREITALLYVFTCIIMPLIGYKYYSESNLISRIWVGFMRVEDFRYFEYALPAISFFTFALTFPIRTKNNSDEGANLQELISKCRQILSFKRKTGLIIIGVGLFVSLFINYLPGELSFFGTLFFFGSFAGLLYVYFTAGLPYKGLMMLAFSLVIINNALNTGMFTIVAYMGIIIFSFFYYGNKTSFIKKLFVVLIGITFILVLQITKKTYRQFTWDKEYTDNKALLFIDLFTSNLQKNSDLIEMDALFPLYTRTNQGLNVSMVMKRIPTIQNFDDGERLTTVILSTFVPRFLWPDKPEAGGKFNMLYYAGVRIKGFSTNVGPLGEAYGSFGIVGGIIYMIILGLFIRWAYIRIFVISHKLPLIICWLPALFFQIIYSNENDTLQILNSLFKSAVFIFILYKFLPSLFKIVESQGKAKKEILSSNQVII